MNPLAQVTLPASLLSAVSLSDANRSSLSRINFMFFSRTNLFQVGPGFPRRSTGPGPGAGGVTPSVCGSQTQQDGRSLNSYVVASSVGNLSIRELTEPVQIQIAHLSEQVPDPHLLFS